VGALLPTFSQQEFIPSYEDERRIFWMREPQMPHPAQEVLGYFKIVPHLRIGSGTLVELFFAH
jgi:hypothetical protein